MKLDVVTHVQVRYGSNTRTNSLRIIDGFIGLRYKPDFLKTSVRSCS